MSQVSQGITTALVGQDGSAPFPVSDYLARRRANPAAINVAVLAGHATIRRRVMGADFRRPATLAEVAQMEALLDQDGDEAGSFTLIDDYGHHPVEMAATIAAARGAFPDRRLVLAFQPHRYTRTRDCFEDFVKVLSTVDGLLLAEVYAAGEAPIVAAEGRSLARAIRVAGTVEPVFVEDIADMPRMILSAARDGDVVITMGAGSIGAVPGKLARIEETV